MFNRTDLSEQKSLKTLENDPKKIIQNNSDYMHFGLSDCPAASPLFLATLNHLFYHVSYMY